MIYMYMLIQSNLHPIYTYIQNIDLYMNSTSMLNHKKTYMSFVILNPPYKRKRKWHGHFSCIMKINQLEGC
jgi:hypothetical protein